jgi:hypothetical protein
MLKIVATVTANSCSYWGTVTVVSNIYEGNIKN